MKVSRVYSAECKEYVAAYFHLNLVKIIGDMGVLSLLVHSSLLRIMGVVARLTYVFADSDQVLWPEPHTAGMTYGYFRSIWFARHGWQSRRIRLGKISAFFHLRSLSRRRHWQSHVTGPG